MKQPRNESLRIAARILLNVLLAVPLCAAPQNEERMAAACATVTVFEQAAPEFRRVIAGISASGLEDAARFVVSYEQAGVLIEAGEPDWAEEQLQAAAAASAALAGRFDSAIAERVGDLRRSQWRLDDARQSYVAAFQTPGTPAIRRAGLARKIAEAESLSGRMEEALAWNAEAAIAAAQAPADPLLPLRIVLQRATLLFDAGREAEAEALRAEAWRKAQAADGPDGRIMVLIEIGLARLYRGDYAGALTHFCELIGLLQQANRSEEEAYAWSILAMAYLLIEDSSSAETALDRGRELAERSTNSFARTLIDAVVVARRFQLKEASGPELLAVFTSLMMTGPARDTAGPSDQMALENALAPDFDPRRPLPLRGISKTLRALQGLRLLQQGHTVEGRQILLEVLDATTSLDFRSFYLSMIGISYLLEQNVEQGIRYYTRAIEEMELAARELRGEEMLTDFFSGDRAVAYDILIKHLLLHGCPEDALLYSERARSRAFLQMIGNRRLNPGREHVPREMEALRARIREWEQQTRLGSAAQRQAAGTDLVHARRRYRELMVRAKVSDPEYAQIVAIEPLDLEGVRRELPAGTSLVSYYVTTNAVHAWIVDRDHLEYVRPAMGSGELQRVVCWSAALRSESGDLRGMAPDDGDCGSGTTSEDIYGLLIAPLRGKIRHPRLIIIPHGLLHYVPFAALRDPATGRYLVQDFTITYAPSISVLRLLRRKETLVDGGARVLGDPVSPAGGSRLSGAQKEAVRIARRFGVRPKLGPAAAEGLLYDLRGRFDLVHIGAHGEYDAGNPLFSRIALARDATHDGALEVHEILADVDLHGVNLVVLSACGTGRGIPTGGDEIVGLTRAVHYAGSPGVISTLWDIDDAATAALMDELYRRLRAGGSAAEALRDAQLALLKRAPYRHPAYWAAFVLSGSPQGRWGRSGQQAEPALRSQ